jgi:PhnB protein
VNYVTAYLNFAGNTREAMTFYQRCLGGELEIMDAAGSPCESVMPNMVIHSRISRNGIPFLAASDSSPNMPVRFGDNFHVCIECESVEEIERLFAAIGQGGEVRMPLADMFWGARFGLVVDKFGVQWMFNHTLHPAAA